MVAVTIKSNHLINLRVRGRLVYIIITFFFLQKDAVRNVDAVVANVQIKTIFGMNVAHGYDEYVSRIHAHC